MKKISKEWLVLIIIAIIVIVIGVSEWNKTKVVNQNGDQDTSGVTRQRAGSPDGEGIQRLEKEEAGVTVIVEPLPEKTKSDSMVFQIALDTHSVNLNEFDFQKDVRLLKDGKIYPPTSAVAGGADHHRNAEVSFKKEAPPFVIVIFDLAGVKERKFEFN